MIQIIFALFFFVNSISVAQTNTHPGGSDLPSGPVASHDDIRKKKDFKICESHYRKQISLEKTYLKLKDIKYIEKETFFNKIDQEFSALLVRTLNQYNKTQCSSSCKKDKSYMVLKNIHLLISESTHCKQFNPYLKYLDKIEQILK